MNLTSIRSIFTPNIPIRWKVSFNKRDMNILGEEFAAKDVSYTALSVAQIEVPIAPGITIPVNTIKKPTTGIDITFYDNNRKQVLAALRGMMGNLEKGRGGFNKASDALVVTITEFNNNMSPSETSRYLVQPSEDVYSKMLVQDAVPYESKLKLIVIGTG